MSISEWQMANNDNRTTRAQPPGVISLRRILPHKCDCHQILNDLPETAERGPFYSWLCVAVNAIRIYCQTHSGQMLRFNFRCHCKNITFEWFEKKPNKMFIILTSPVIQCRGWSIIIFVASAIDVTAAAGDSTVAARWFFYIWISKWKRIDVAQKPTIKWQW